MKRREFLVAAAALPVACTIGKPAPAPHPYGYFNPGEARAMDAWLECLLPANVPPGTPGARDAGVLTYLDRQMQQPHYANVARAVRRTIARLQEASKPSQFADLPVTEQHELLARVQTGQLTDNKINTQKTFELVQGFALEGFLGDPKHGGNQQSVVWNSLGKSPACPH